MKLASRAIIVHEGKILLVQHKGRDFYSLPGGKIDPDEDIKSALKRELVEELGIESEIGNLLFLHEFQYPGGSLSVEFFFWIDNPEDFVGKDLSGELTEEELAKIEWKDVTDDLDIMPKFLQEKLASLTGSEEMVEYESSV